MELPKNPGVIYGIFPLKYYDLYMQLHVFLDQVLGDKIVNCTSKTALLKVRIKNFKKKKVRMK